MGKVLGIYILIDNWLFWAALPLTAADYTKTAHVVLIRMKYILTLQGVQESDFLILYT
jgi:hypothetical protein